MPLLILLVCFFTRFSVPAPALSLEKPRVAGVDGAWCMSQRNCWTCQVWLIPELPLQIISFVFSFLLPSPPHTHMHAPMKHFTSGIKE